MDHPAFVLPATPRSLWDHRNGTMLREWLMEHFVPLLPKCQLDDAECLYSKGIETNKELQCHLRRLDYVVAQTEGIFRHMNPVWLGREECEKDAGGYWWPDRGRCRVWV